MRMTPWMHQVRKELGVDETVNVLLLNFGGQVQLSVTWARNLTSERNLPSVVGKLNHI